MRILVVDDDPRLREELSAFLRANRMAGLVALRPLEVAEGAGQGAA